MSSSGTERPVLLVSRFSTGCDYKPDGVIRVGDLVWLRKPREFVRCGYDFTLSDACREVDGRCGGDIDRLVDAAGHAGELWGMGVRLRALARQRVLRALASVEMCSRFRDGAERKLYFEDRPTLADAVLRVKWTRTKQTGVYRAGTRSRGGWSASTPEVCPPTLEARKHHRLLDCALEFLPGFASHVWGADVLSTDVTKLHPDPRWAICGQCGRDPARGGHPLCREWVPCAVRRCPFQLETLLASDTASGESYPARLCQDVPLPLREA